MPDFEILLRILGVDQRGWSVLLQPNFSPSPLTASKVWIERADPCSPLYPPGATASPRLPDNSCNNVGCFRSREGPSASMLKARRISPIPPKPERTRQLGGKGLPGTAVETECRVWSFELYDWPQLPGITSTHPASPKNKLNTISIPSFGDSGLRLWDAGLDALIRRNYSPSVGKGYHCSHLPRTSTLCDPPYPPNPSYIPHSSYSPACLGFCNSISSRERDHKGGTQAPPIWCLPYSLERGLPGTATSRIRSPDKPHPMAV